MSTLDFNQIFSSVDIVNFEKIALKVFNYQVNTNKLYERYVQLLGVKPDSVLKIEQIPFMPIDFFKYHRVSSGNWKSKEIFYSSGTTTSTRSQHHQKTPGDYLKLSTSLFEEQYGKLENYIIIALLPSYIESGGSSLVKMVNHFISKTNHRLSTFCLGDSKKEILHVLDKAQEVKGRKVILFGVSYALLDLAEEGVSASDVIIIETGGMKGRREEMTREDLHAVLCKNFNVDYIHSEYGMTELMSQFYSLGSGKFRQAITARVLIREIDDPFSYAKNGKVGGINIIDLANVHSCSFIETKDLGKKVTDDEFLVLGRFDNSDVRGCNLLYTTNSIN